MKELTYIAIDQSGYSYKCYTKFPRKELMQLLGASKANKMYIGNGIHVGYVIAGQWLTLYKLTRIDDCK